LNGLAGGVTGFFSANKTSIVFSAAIATLHPARPGTITGPGIIPHPVGAGLVHVAEAAALLPRVDVVVVGYIIAIKVKSILGAGPGGG